MIGMYALTAAITTFVAQNHGARNAARIKESLRFVTKAALVWGAVIAVLVFAASGLIARIFNDDAEVVSMTTSYLRIVPLSYAPFGVAIGVAAMLNALDLPLKATGLAAIRLLVLAIPLAWLGSALYELTGVFFGIVAANLIMGLIAGVYARQKIWGLAAALERATPTAVAPAE